MTGLDKHISSEELMRRVDEVERGSRRTEHVRSNFKLMAEYSSILPLYENSDEIGIGSEHFAIFADLSLTT